VINATHRTRAIGNEAGVVSEGAKNFGSTSRPAALDPVREIRADLPPIPLIYVQSLVDGLLSQWQSQLASNQKKGGA
jgi:hypothetical protein